MHELVFDVETTKKPLHDPFNSAAKLIYYGGDDGNCYGDCAIEYTDNPYAESLAVIQRQVDACDILIGANPKFDHHWCHRYGIDFTGKMIWDVLLVQFILNHQRTPFTSLNDVAAHWGLEQKLDIVKTEYWDKGLETTEVPEEILRDYLRQDVALTKQIYHLQMDEVKKRGIMPLIRLHNQDLLMLCEMEWNGNMYDIAGSLLASAGLKEQIAQKQERLNSLSPIVPKCWSTDFVSMLLYGGAYKYIEREAYTFTYKDGSTAEKWHNVAKFYELPRLTEPPKQARAKEGFWPTDEATLKKLKTTGVATKIVATLLELRDLDKMNGTYFEGFPKRIEECGWEGNLIHTNYSQTTAVTGRLASSKPNMQNNPPNQKQFFISRYGE